MNIDLFLGQELGKYYCSVSDTLEANSGHQYEITDRINAGGNGVVHKCLNSITGDEYAIKFQLDNRGNRLKRFLREQKLLETLQHEHSITYIDHGEIEADSIKDKNKTSVNIPFVIMELAEDSLYNHIKNNNLGNEVFSAQFYGLTKALANLHQYAIHRDIKPNNILILGERWLLSDFGLCTFLDDDTEQLTKTYETVGPRFWMSPEANNRSVGKSDAIDKSSDVFQLAAVFWFIVNKTHPTGVLTRNDWHGPEHLFEPIFKALHYDRKIRPKDGLEFSKQIENAIYL
ncbi:MAG: protein kinase [Methylobacter sp.]|nr:protein kinase [Methylobacter sp.]